MPRYLLFSYNRYYPEGGMNDLVAASNSWRELKKVERNYRPYDFTNLYDTVTLEEPAADAPDVIEPAKHTLIFAGLVLDTRKIEHSRYECAFYRREHPVTGELLAWAEYRDYPFPVAPPTAQLVRNDIHDFYQGWHGVLEYTWTDTP